jgi:hypothetical protein
LSQASRLCRRGRARTPGVSCALSIGGGSFINSGAIALRERGFTSSNVIASEAKQSILSLRCKMDCFASLAMTVVLFET